MIPNRTVPRTISVANSAASAGVAEGAIERRASAVVMNNVMKKPDLSDPKLRAKVRVSHSVCRTSTAASGSLLCPATNFLPVVYSFVPVVSHVCIVLLLFFCPQLAKGMGHNYYGEPAWPNDLLYMFPVCIVGMRCLYVGYCLTLVRKHFPPSR